MHRAADALAIPGAQRPKGQRGDDGQPAQGHESAMQRRDDCEPIGLRQISKIPCRHQRSAGQAEAHGDLLKRAGYRARHARLIRLDVRIGHAVHAGKLQRINRRGKVYPTRLRLGTSWCFDFRVAPKTSHTSPKPPSTDRKEWRGSP